MQKSQKKKINIKNMFFFDFGEKSITPQIIIIKNIIFSMQKSQKKNGFFF